jgi:hypothetical protein
MCMPEEAAHLDGEGLTFQGHDAGAVLDWRQLLGDVAHARKRARELDSRVLAGTVACAVPEEGVIEQAISRADDVQPVDVLPWHSALKQA